MLVSLVLVLLSCRALGASKRSQPCLSGSCSVDVEESTTSMGGTMRISGATSAISDITPAAGWLILDCSDSTNNQTIRLVCTDESLGCAHLFENGAQDTIVRLPESCGTGPFVRVVNHSISEDQSLPRTLKKRGGSIPQAHLLQVDDRFEQSAGRHGNVSFEINTQSNLRVGLEKKRHKRQTGSGSPTEDIDISPTNLVFLNFSSTCPAADDTTRSQVMFGEVGLLQAAINSTIIITAIGTLSPFNIESLSFSAPSEGNIFIDSNFEAGVQGSTNIEGLLLGSQGFPSFSIDGVLTVTPSFIVDATSTIFAQGLTNFAPLSSFSTAINNLQFTYPSNNPPASVEIDFTPGPFDVLASPVQNSQAEFTISCNSTMHVQVASNSVSSAVDLTVTYAYEADMKLNSIVASENTEEVFISLTGDLSVIVANSGPFFDAFSEPGSQTIFSAAATPLVTGTVIPLGPTPSVTRRSESNLQVRDGFSCPPLAALPQSPISIV